MLRALGFDTASGLHFGKLSAALNRRALAYSEKYLKAAQGGEEHHHGH